MNKRFLKTFYAFLRLVVGLGIIFSIGTRIDFSEFQGVLQDCLRQWRWVAAALVLAGCILGLGAVRWRLMLRACAVPLPSGRLWRIYLIGHFFNAFMLGMAGGDLVRVFYTARATGCRKTQALGTVLMDRLSGMGMVYLVAGMMMAIHVDLFRSEWRLHLPALIMLGMIAGGCLLALLVFNVHRFRRWRVFNMVRRYPRLAEFMHNLLLAVDVFRQRPLLILQSSALSLIGQILLVLQCYCLGRSLMLPLGFFDYLAVIPLIASIAAIPVTPGGLGIREVLAVSMLGALGVPSSRSLPLSLMIYGSSLAWSLVGGLFFVIYSSSAGHTVREEVAELHEEVTGETGEAGVAGAHQQ
ncbi:MAG: lysylphosphatidylglycerol synthase transmembrane domain-containing protein [Kiritimatiellia bacterium]